jgi:hypothetical protein
LGYKPSSFEKEFLSAPIHSPLSGRQSGPSLWSENFKGSLNKENEVPRVFLFGLFIWPNWELGNRSHLAFFCTHAVAMVSPRSVELKQGAEEPSMEEGKRCELKLPVEIKRTACIRCGGRVPTGAIISCNLSHLFFPSANLYACQDQFSCI